MTRTGVAPAAVLDLFSTSPGLAAEHRRLMDARRRRVQWAESTAATLPSSLREGLGHLWRDRMVAEHRSVGVFALYLLDLLGTGAPAEVLSHACRASLDEVRHAELFGRLAALYTGREESPPHGIPAMPDDPSIAMRHQTAREALHLSVLSETYSSVLLHELHRAARDPVVRDVLGIVMADEVHHARMGWAYLASLLAHDDGSLRACLQLDLHAVVDGLVASLFGDPVTLRESSVRPEHRALAAAHGYLAPSDEWDLFRSTVTEVWVPGLARLGLDASGLDDRYPARPEVAG